MPASVDMSALRISSTSDSPTAGESVFRRCPAYSFCESIARRNPKPNSALSSKSELFQAGPRPSRFVAYGVVGRFPP